MILPDICQQTSHQGLSCVTPDDAARQDQSWATLHPVLPPGEVGRTMLIGSDPPRSRGKSPSPDAATGQICSMETTLLQRAQTPPVPAQDGRSLCLCACGEMMWHKSCMSSSPGAISNKYRSIFPSTALTYFPAWLWGYKNMCLDPAA